MADELDWRIRARRGSERHEAALGDAGVVFEDFEVGDE